MYWTLELASYLDDAPWPATKDQLIDFADRLTFDDALPIATCFARILVVPAILAPTVPVDLFNVPLIFDIINS